MPNMPSLLEMLKSGAHFGHSTSKWHPKMEPYIFTVRSGVHIINLEKTAEELAKALEFVKKTVANNGKVLFVGTKKQAQPVIKKYAEQAKMPYVVNHWMGGTLTNYSIINKLVERMKKMRQDKVTGDWEKYTKKEQIKMQEEYDKLEQMAGGLESLNHRPEALFIVDIKKEKTALREAIKMKLPVVALCDTNVNPDGIKHVIPANDDATKTIELITKLIAEAAIEGQAAQTLAPADKQSIFGEIKKEEAPQEDNQEK
ncbi:MAG: 30S ribosomal protein S2 [bacterium]